jgi:hypothetical protein
MSFADGLSDLLKSGLILKDTTAVSALLVPPPSSSSQQEEEEEANQKHWVVISALDGTFDQMGRLYANPCMAILEMFNVFIILQNFGLLINTTTNAEKTIIWLDGHAQGNLDRV